MAPPDMPAALYAKAVDAYCTGEPFGAAAQQAGYARPLRMTRDEWRNYICCVLTVREELIRANPAMVQDLVNQILGAGIWLDRQQENRDKAVAIAAGRDFFNQDPKIFEFVMENPKDRVTYGDLRMIRAEFDDLMQLSIAAGTIKHPIAYETYVDETFAKERTSRRHFLVSAHELRDPPCAAVGLHAVVHERACGRIRRAEGGRVQSGARGAGFFRSRLRRLDAHSQPLSRQGGAAGIWLYLMPQCLSGHAGGSRAGASETRSPGAQVQVIYLTVDPERDNAERLKQYLAAFDPTFVGGTGTAAQMAAVR